MRDEHNKSPTTVREIGIHLGYLREDIEKMNDKIEEAIKNYATKVDVEELKSEVHEIEVKVARLTEFKVQQETSFWNTTGKTIERGAVAAIAAGVLGIVVWTSNQGSQINRVKEQVNITREK